MATAGGNPLYYVEDLLGTSRVITSNTGVVCYDADFYPYGGERSYTNTCSQNYKFEGKERDTETGNDDFGARYYSNRFGRWLSADWSSVPVPVPYANLSNPQTLNLYAMVADDPESFADLDGHDGIPAVPSCAGKAALGPNCTQSSASTTEAQKKEVLTQEQQKPEQKPEPPQTNNDKKPEQEKDQQQTPSAAGPGRGGGPGKGERGRTSKPDKPGKGVRRLPDGRWEVRDPQTGKKIIKPRDWSPTQRSIVEGAAAAGLAVGTGYVIYRVVRMLPSLSPPLWWTIPFNLATP